MTNNKPPLTDSDGLDNRFTLKDLLEQVSKRKLKVAVAYFNIGLVPIVLWNQVAQAIA